MGVTGAELELPFDPPLAPGSGQLASFFGSMETALGTAGLAPEGPVDGVAISALNPRTGRSHLLYVSENLAATVGRQPHELLGESPSVLLPETTPIAQLEAVGEVVSRGEQAVVNLDLLHRTGHHVPVQATFLAIPSMTRGVSNYLSLYRAFDAPRSEGSIDHLDMLDALARGNELGDVLEEVAGRIRAAISGADCWIALADRTGSLEPTLTGEHRLDLVEGVLGYLTESGDSSTLRRVRADDMPLEIGFALRDVDIHAVWSMPITRPDGRLQGRLVVTHPDRSDPHPSEHQMLAQLARVVAVAVQRSTTEATLAHQALHDSLTQLPNRALIVDRLEQAVARLGRDNTRLAALLVDMDRFKNLNDTRGPEVGDEVLLEVSRRLRKSVRLGDTVGRIGGDQFLVLCVAMNGEADAAAMADRVVNNVAEPIALGTHEISVTASVGVVLVDRPGHAPATIISSAESALAKAVEGGRGGYALFEEELQQKVVVRHEVEQALHVALSADELVVFYQPIVQIDTGQMIGAEALIRWDRPGHGLLPPAAFIEIAEETGLIVPVGAWVIDEVCRQLSEWPQVPGRAAPVISVNLSAKQLAEDSLVSTIIGAMDRHGVSADQLAFEVTESMRVEDLETAISALRRIAALGCKISIDDFGIGYATLDYLRRFSMANTIKIDRSFVNGLNESREDTAIVDASLALARSLGLTVVAEGVETHEQYAALRDMKCEFAQGYVLSPPVPLEQSIDLWVTGTLIDLDLLP